MARGTRKIFYGFTVERVNPGPGGDTELISGGFKADPAVAPASYPNPEYRISSLNTAISKALAFVRRFQSAGIDSKATVYYAVFGADATNPVRALGAGEDGFPNGHRVCDLDVPERSIERAVSLANRELDAEGDIDSQMPQDLDPPAGG